MSTRALAAAALLAALAAPSRATALDRWTWQDTAWEAGFAATLAVDWQQTQWAVAHGRLEADPFAVAFIGKRPSRERLALGCLAGASAHAAISVLLPTRWRRGWQTVTLGLEAGAVGFNGARIGFHADF